MGRGRKGRRHGALYTSECPGPHHPHGDPGSSGSGRSCGLRSLLGFLRLPLARGGTDRVCGRLGVAQALRRGAVRGGAQQILQRPEVAGGGAGRLHLAQPLLSAPGGGW